MSVREILTNPTDPIQEAIKKLQDEPGGLFENHILEALRDLKAKNPAAFAKIRQQVKESKQVQMAELDRLTAPRDKDKPADKVTSLFPPVAFWPDPVDGAELLNDLTATVQRHIIADKETIRAAALWAVFTWFVDAVQVAPIANITAPEKRCGKSEMLSILGRLAYRPMQVSGVSPSALFRSIEVFRPTLLIDEVDAFLRDNEEARGILNAGFTRDAAFIIRCVGDDHTPTPFNIWGAKALCGIGKIADTLADRSIPLRLRRKKAGETVERQRQSDPAIWENLRNRIARFAQDNMTQVGICRPATIEGLNDRANDCWEPMLAIAEVAGGSWPLLARNAAIALHGIEEEVPTIGVELLRDIKSIFDEKDCTRIFTSHLLEALTEDDEQPWATWNRGKPLSPRQLANKLSDFGIKSKQIRIGHETGKKGFDRDDFKDAWNRYLPPEGGKKRVYALHPTDGEASSDFSVSTQNSTVEQQKPLQPTDGEGCSGVDDRKPPAGERKAWEVEV